MSTKPTLELKHLAPYLPYGLKILVTTERGDEEIETMDMYNIQWVFNEENMISPKPILRPLSDLTKEITHGDDTFTPAKTLGLETDHNTWYQRTPLMLRYNNIVKLFEWHFDVFGLIPAGLAIEKK